MLGDVVAVGDEDESLCSAKHATSLGLSLFLGASLPVCADLSVPSNINFGSLSSGEGSVVQCVLEKVRFGIEVLDKETDLAQDAVFTLWWSSACVHVSPGLFLLDDLDSEMFDTPNLLRFSRPHVFNLTATC